MGKAKDSLTPKTTAFINAQKMFFVATAAKNGYINLSPKGGAEIKVVDSKKIVWLNYTGSGNETAAHLLQLPRITLMFCAFEGRPNILRVYGEGKCHHPGDPSYTSYISLFKDTAGVRQIVEITVEQVTDSCGFGVPLMQFQGHRPELKEWIDSKGEEGIKAYWKAKNVNSIDGFDTGIRPYLDPE